MSAKKEGAKSKLLKYFKEHIAEEIPRDILAKLVDYTGGWERSLRSLRDDGYIVNYNHSNKTYIFPFSEPQNAPRDNRYIDKTTRSLVMIRDNSTCQMCGKTVKYDFIKIHIDHITPYEWGGLTCLDNLQCLCSECNEGKKNFVANENPELMKSICSSNSCIERLRIYFDFYANQEIGVDKLSVVGRTREWTRELRRLRSDYEMNIEYRPKKANIREIDCYIYITDN